MTKGIIPFGFVVKYILPNKPGIVVGMFWNEGEEGIFLCDDCSFKELKSIRPPLIKIEKGWNATDEIQEELDERGHHVATYHPDTSIKCKRCGLIVPVNLEQA
jgi:DNA-directed RNA polymerase subunit RPC12/RpoP